MGPALYVCGAVSPAGRKGRLTLIDRGDVHSQRLTELARRQTWYAVCVHSHTVMHVLVLYVYIIMCV